MRDDSSNPTPRRSFLAASLLAALGGLLSRRRLDAQGQPQAAPAAPPADGLVRSGEPLTTRLRLGSPPVPPLDSMVVFERGDDNNGRAMTHEVLSLIHQEKGKNSYPWTLYASLETHHEAGDACVVCSRLHKYGPGWSAGLHSEVFNHSRAVALGVNIEMSSDYAGPEPTEVIGLNIQATGGPAPMQYGIQLQDGQGRFETGIGMKGHGKTGVDLAGKYDIGIHTHGNTIRVSEGTCVEFDDTGQIRMRYVNGRIEFLNGEVCVGHIDMSGKDHAM